MTTTKVSLTCTPFVVLYSKSSHEDSAYVFIGGLNYELTEGDVIAIFSQ